MEFRVNPKKCKHYIITYSQGNQASAHYSELSKKYMVSLYCPDCWSNFDWELNKPVIRNELIRKTGYIHHSRASNDCGGFIP